MNYKNTKKIIYTLFLTGLFFIPVIILAESKYDVPKEPFDGLNVTIERGAEVTNNRKVLLLFNALNDVDKIAISNTEDFSKASIEPYIGLSEWNLSEGVGEKTVYVIFYTRYGIPSRIIKDTIIYIEEADPEKDHVTIKKEDLKAQDLFKTNQSNAVYYYGYDNKRYVFPIESIFYSWYSADDFKNVKIVSSEVLSGIPIGGNVRYRPGKRLVKIETDPKVYSVGFNGDIHWIQTEEIARSLYGPNWAKLVSDIPISLFGNYTVSNDISLEDIPNGMLFSEGEKNTVYVSDDGMKRPIISQESFYLNRFNFDDVKHFEKTNMLLGTDITGSEKRYNDTAQTGSND